MPSGAPAANVPSGPKPAPKSSGGPGSGGSSNHKFFNPKTDSPFAGSSRSENTEGVSHRQAANRARQRGEFDDEDEEQDDDAPRQLKQPGRRGGEPRHGRSGTRRGQLRSVGNGSAVGVGGFGGVAGQTKQQWLGGAAQPGSPGPQQPQAQNGSAQPQSSPASATPKWLPGRLKKTVAAFDQLSKVATKAQQGDEEGAIEEIDKILNIGYKIGDLLFFGWLGSIPVMGMMTFGLGTIPGVIMLNILLVSPKTAYRLTELLLLPTGLGEYLKAADKAGIKKVKIKIHDWQKMVIVFVDAIALLVVTLIISVLLAVVCYIASYGGAAATVASYLANPVVGVADSLVGAPVGLQAACAKLDGVTSSFGYSTPPTVGPITASGCSNQESGGCNRNTIAQCPAMAAQMDNALRACNQESNGGQVAIASGTDKCQLPDGSYISFSIGLWQINMLDSTQPEFPECQGALIQTSYDPNRCVTRNSNGQCIVRYRTCRFGDRGQAGYDACRAALSNPARNTRQACTLFNSRGWNPWPYTRDVCGLPSGRP